MSDEIVYVTYITCDSKTTIVGVYQQKHIAMRELFMYMCHTGMIFPNRKDINIEILYEKYSSQILDKYYIENLLKECVTNNNNGMYEKSWSYGITKQKLIGSQSFSKVIFGIKRPYEFIPSLSLENTM